MFLTNTPTDIAEFIGTVRVLDAEFMYRPRPVEPRARAVFDFTLASRLTELDGRDAVLLICDSETTVESLGHLPGQFPGLRFAAVLVNPEPLVGDRSDTPARLGWPEPERWQRYTMTDRWARIRFALQVAAKANELKRATRASPLNNLEPGTVGTRHAVSGFSYLAMPAHDAVWGSGLLDTLIAFSQTHAKQGIPAAVSPYTAYQHSSVPGVAIPQAVIDTVNAAFGLDPLQAWRFMRDELQGFWGKMGLLPFALAPVVLETAQMDVWEDDLEIDSQLRAAGYGVRTLWCGQPNVYRQALPVFDLDGVRRVIDRTLHYSLNIPSPTLGSSSLNFPPGPLYHLRQHVDADFAHASHTAEQLVAECVAEIGARLATVGASWVDWGRYRYVMRVGDPSVEVWHNPTQY